MGRPLVAVLVASFALCAAMTACMELAVDPTPTPQYLLDPYATPNSFLSNLTPVPAASTHAAARYAISGTGGDGVRLRESPGPGEVVAMLPEGEVVISLDESASVDGRLWRRVQRDNGDTGWIAGDYLAEEADGT